MAHDAGPGWRSARPCVEGRKKYRHQPFDSRERSEAELLTIEDKNSLLLGIKYEAARIGGVEGGPLKRIEDQLRAEVGEGWETDAEVLKGRNATRREHGLPPVGETKAHPGPEITARRPLWRRMFGR